MNIYQQNQIIKSPTKENQNRQFVILKELAIDANGIIYEAKAEQSCYLTNVAIKVYNNIKEHEEKMIDWLIQQQQNNNTQIIKIYEKFEYNQRKYIIMELGGCNLNDYLIQNKTLSYFDKFKIFIQTLKAIKFLHENEYVCGEFNTKNYVYFQNTFKLTGFGQKKKLQNKFPQFNLIQSSKDDDIRSLINLFCEIYLGEQFFKVQNQKEINNKKNDYLSKLTSIQNQEITNLIKQLLLNPDQLNINQVIDKDYSLKQIFQESIFKEVQQQQLSQFQGQQIKEINNQKQLFQSQINLKNLKNTVLQVPTEEFPQRQFIFTEKLGDGGEGVVYLGKTKNETVYNTNIAIKIQLKIKENELKFLDELIDYQNNKEKQTFIKSNLVRIYEIYKWQDKHLIVMELGGKNLYDYLKEQSQQTFNQKLQICQQITQAISFLHKKKLIHRDIKPENFIQCGSVFKLIDFGLIKLKDQDIRLTKMVGTPLYQAVEIINGSEYYSFPVDVWSLGCLFYEIFKYAPLFDFNTIDQVKQAIFKYCQNQQEIHNQIDQLEIKQELKYLIKQMIDPIPQKRPTIDEVLRQLSSINTYKFISKIVPDNSNDLKVLPNQTNEQLKKQKLDDIPNRLMDVIKDYCQLQMEIQYSSKEDQFSQEYQQLIQNMKDLTIKQWDEHIENYYKQKQMENKFKDIQAQDIKQGQTQKSPNLINYNNQMQTRCLMVPPSNYHKNSMEIEPPTFDSSVIITQKTDKKQELNGLQEQNNNYCLVQQLNSQNNNGSQKQG
ncbi:unnamed protein product [Paramecium pentaurelia]|uniref:Protein kinase domain-containing protein n=1 Tax=Paramecium pentaurelia TaxID=43138 RepID=A0A8S1VV90_9CILI|nr:unnamed protein product [Paramecium pentaurelia]